MLISAADSFIYPGALGGMVRFTRTQISNFYSPQKRAVPNVATGGAVGPWSDQGDVRGENKHDVTPGQWM